jgi:hypothetical protein
MTKRWTIIATALLLVSCETPLRSVHAQAEHGTAWQCGRDYIELDSYNYGYIWYNKKGPYGEGQETFIWQPGRSREAEILAKRPPWRNGILYYRSGGGYGRCTKKPTVPPLPRPRPASAKADKELT